jgi:hypothetical protein
MHHQARRQAEKIHAPVRLHGENGAHRQMLLTDRHQRPRQSRQGATETFIEPDLTGLRAAGARHAGRARLQANRQAAA